MQFVLVSLADEPYLDFDYPSFHVLGFLLPFNSYSNLSMMGFDD